MYGLEGYQKLYSLDHGAVQEVKVGFVSLCFDVCERYHDELPHSGTRHPNSALVVKQVPSSPKCSWTMGEQPLR